MTCDSCKSCGKPICGCSDPEYQGVVRDLARVRAIFQLRAVTAALGIHPDTPAKTDATLHGRETGSAVTNHTRAALSGEGGRA